jgi:hypothetical protein
MVDVVESAPQQMPLLHLVGAYIVVSGPRSFFSVMVWVAVRPCALCFHLPKFLDHLLLGCFVVLTSSASVPPLWTHDPWSGGLPVGR